jgi:hypothetical protein
VQAHGGSCPLPLSTAKLIQYHWFNHKANCQKVFWFFEGAAGFRLEGKEIARWLKASIDEALVPVRELTYARAASIPQNCLPK